VLAPWRHRLACIPVSRKLRPQALDQFTEIPFSRDINKEIIEKGSQREVIIDFASLVACLPVIPLVNRSGQPNGGSSVNVDKFCSL
jgi:hypothetical protein